MAQALRDTEPENPILERKYQRFFGVPPDGGDTLHGESEANMGNHAGSAECSDGDVEEPREQVRARDQEKEPDLLEDGTPVDKRRRLRALHKVLPWNTYPG